MHAFRDPDSQFAVENLLGHVHHGVADAGEVLGTVDRIPDGDAARIAPALCGERTVDRLDEHVRPVAEIDG